MDENRFWLLIELAWKSVGGKETERKQLANSKLSQEDAEALQETLEEVIPALQKLLELLSAEKLLAFDRILEQKMYDIDREEVHYHTDGSDDGFLYARGFIVAVGRDYYNAVNIDPRIALMDLECEEMCYISRHLYEDKFGKMPESEISRETCSNKSKWPSKQL